MEKTITIGIATYNRHHILKHCIKHILQQTKKPDEVIIVDSTREIFRDPELLELEKFCKTIYLKQEEKTPLPKGRNIILSKCHTDIISFIDDDSLISTRFIQTIADTFTDEKIAGATGPTINSTIDLTYKENIISNNSTFNTYITPWGDIYSNTRRWIPTKQIECSTMIGANMSFQTQILKSVGGFDENLFNPSFREDTDPQIKIRRFGYKFIYHPDIFVYHITEQSGGIEDIEKKKNKYFFLAGQNHRYFCDKHYPKILTRIAWFFLNRTPPNFFLALFLTLIRKENYLMWHKGLWSKNDTTHHEKE